ncbi:hypothetical protein F5Y12DRAFT_710154 [Xylaria sp. FL1777]|nr:hypothetical protein F5Y12DRAFT_710154 [Xylaria sp. FL1777]
MAESGHDFSSSDQPSNPPPVKSPAHYRDIASINRSNISSDLSGLNSSTEHDQMFELASSIKQEVSCERRVDRALNNEDNAHQADSKTESVNLFSHLQKATTSEEVEVLSSHQSTGVDILGELGQRLCSNTKYINTARMSSIHALMKRVNTPRTVLGVVGGTGHGKSSLINALLEETKLVPTNCFRACTAVVTEISWNPSDNPDHRYTAEVEFISIEDWDLELEYLVHDLVSSSGEVSSDVRRTLTHNRSRAITTRTSAYKVKPLVYNSHL